ncbi:MAG: hypothetical protein HUU56_06410 [Bdellovibrionaceae bacterium]|nr:hypothetical protein [Pseudobdellovibrionaceae bacterium]
MELLIKRLSASIMLLFLSSLFAKDLLSNGQIQESKNNYKKNSDVVVFSPVEIKNKSKKKSFFLNKKELIAGKNHTFADGEFLIKSELEPVFIYFVSGVKIKLEPFSELQLVQQVSTSQADWRYRIVLMRGSFFVFQKVGKINFKVDNLFDFFLLPGELRLDFDEKKKIFKIQSFGGDQMVQIVDDDRVHKVLSGNYLQFEAQWNDGEMEYDFLLNDRKVPRFNLTQGKSDAGLSLKTEDWKRQPSVSSEALARAEDGKSAKLVVKSHPSSAVICKNPKASYGECYWRQDAKDQGCYRFFCNLNGEWAQGTNFGINKDCPKQATLKPCEWMR